MSLERDCAAQTDEQLFELYLTNKDAEIFSVLYERHYKELVRFIYNRFVRNHATAEDIAQHTFLTVHTGDYWCLEREEGHAEEKPSTYKPGMSFAKWLYSLAGNWAIRQTVLSKRVKSGGGVTPLSLNDADRVESSSTWADTVQDDPASGTDLLEVFVEDADGGGIDRFSPEAVYASLEGLTEEQSTVLTLRFYERKSERDVAEELSISRHEVRRIAREGQNIMRAKLLSANALV